MAKQSLPNGLPTQVPTSPHPAAVAEAPVVELLRAALKVEDSYGQGVLDRFVDAFRDATEGRPFSDEGYLAMRQIYVATHGGIDDLVDGKLAELFPPPPSAAISSPLLGDYDRDQVDAMVDTLNRDGLYRFERTLPADFLASLRQAVLDTPPQPGDDLAKARFFYDNTYLYRQEQAWALISDPLVLQLAGRHLRSQPIFDFVTAYHSHPAQSSYDDLSAAAQLFHFDKDRLSFIKLFVYLYDVTPSNGPHVFVTGSHRTKPDALWHDGRFSDEEIAAHFPADAIQSVIGPAGSVFLGDTRAFHKGTPVQQGERLVFQIQYSNSVAGKHDPVPVTKADNGFARQLAQRFPRLMARVA